MKLYNTLALCKHKTLNLLHSLEDPKLPRESLSVCSSGGSLGPNTLKSSEGYTIKGVCGKEEDEELKLSSSGATEPSTFVGKKTKSFTKKSGKITEGISHKFRFFGNFGVLIDFEWPTFLRP